MTLKLFPYQMEGAQWLASRKTGLLADEPRLGKAVQSIAALDIINAKSAIVVCRGVARANWSAEFARWSSRNWVCHPIYGRTPNISFATDGRPNVVITSYESLEGALSASVGIQRFDVAIIDEAHYVKSVDAKRTRLVLGREGIPAKASRVWATTGTPTPNGLASELWPLLYTFGATKLSFWEFAKRFCHVEENGYGLQIKGTNLDRIPELQALMRPKVLRREAKDVAVQLPKMSFSTVMVPPGVVDIRATTFWKYAIPIDRTAELNALLEKELGIIEGIMDGQNLSPALLETLKAQSKSISTLRKYTALQKLDAACELISAELDAGAYQKVVIFAHHRDCILGAMQRLHRFYPVCMYGGTSPARLERHLKNFQNPKHKTRIFIGQISAAGTSISLNAANHIFFLEESFVPDDNTQAAMRCGGVNQPKPIFVRTFCLQNSYDQRLQDIIRMKMAENAKIYDNLMQNEKIPSELEGMI